MAASLTRALLVVALAVMPGESRAQPPPAPQPAPKAAPAAVTYRASFPWHDAELLLPGESNGGQVVAPAGVPFGERAPLVVLLHGVNVDRGPHMWLGARSLPDLGVVAERMVATGAAPPFLFAAPSQTRGAMSGRFMWKDFDLDEFVQAVDDALGPRARVDRSAVVVMGHSGAACNPDGGLLRVARQPGKVVPRAIVAVDTCLDDDAGDALGRAPSSVGVWVRWQPEIWPRPIDRFRAAFRDAAGPSGRDEPVIQRVDGLGPNAHEAILPDTFTSLLPSLLGRRDDDSAIGGSDP